MLLGSVPGLTTHHALEETPMLGRLGPQDVNVLVVDDDDTSRTIVSAVLRGCNYRVRTAGSGAEAIELLQREAPDTFHLVLSDVRMPDITGLDLLSFMQQDATLSSMPVILMSGMETEGLVHAAVTSGADEYLSKPVTRKEAALMWQHVLRRRAAARARVPPQVAEPLQEQGEVGPPDGATTAFGRVGAETARHAVQVALRAAPLATPLSSQGRAEDGCKSSGSERGLRPPTASLTASIPRRSSDASQLTMDVGPTADRAQARGAAGAQHSTHRAHVEPAAGASKAAAADVLSVLCALRDSQREAARGLGASLESVGADLAAAGARGPAVARKRRGGVGARQATPQKTGALPAKRRALRDAAAEEGSDGEGEGAPQAEQEADTQAVVPGSEVVDAAMSLLQDVYFQDVVKAADHDKRLQSFAQDLAELTRCSKLEVLSTLNSGHLGGTTEVICEAAFDAYEEHFASVGVSRVIRVYDFQALLATPRALQYPILQLHTRSRLSSLSWNSYLPGRLLTADFDGGVQLWDVGQGADLSFFEEHTRRVWSVDFSRTDPARFATAGGDACVRLWSTGDENSVATISVPAPACCVEHRPDDNTQLAVGCADERSYIYDLRSTQAPLSVLCGASRAVSYVRWSGPDVLLAASTDSSVRAWRDPGGLGTEGGARPEAVYRGHVNQRGFVGLDARPDGRFVVGSETNSVYAYCRGLPFHTACHTLEAGDYPSQRTAFTTSVAMARRSRHCLVANSSGVLQVLLHS